MASFLSLYTILNVPENATIQVIKSAFRKLAKIHHPDKNNNTLKSKAVFMTIHHAYSILVDPAKRREYDSYLNASAVFKNLKKNRFHKGQIFLEESGSRRFSIENLFGHVNFLLWDIEIFLQDIDPVIMDQEYSGRTVKQYLLMILIFIDKWILDPAGYRDYFMEARKKQKIDISDYVYIIGSKLNKFGHSPFAGVTDYFYDIRKRTDRFLNRITYEDLFKSIPGCSIRIVDSIIEAQNYTIHYLNSLNNALSGESDTIRPFEHSNPCFES